MNNDANQAKLYVVYLGGDLMPGRMGEDHEVVVVAAAVEAITPSPPRLV